MEEWLQQSVCHPEQSEGSRIQRHGATEYGILRRSAPQNDNCCILIHPLFAYNMLAFLAVYGKMFLIITKKLKR